MLHKVGGVWIELPTSEKSQPARVLCAQKILRFHISTVGSAPARQRPAPALLSGQVTNLPTAHRLGGARYYAQRITKQTHDHIASGSYSFAVEDRSFYNVTPERELQALLRMSALSHHRNVTECTFTAVPKSSRH